MMPSRGCSDDAGLIIAGLLGQKRSSIRTVKEEGISSSDQHLVSIADLE